VDTRTVPGDRSYLQSKKFIAELEALTPRTPKVEAALREAKETERQLRDAAKDPTFIYNLVKSSLKKTSKMANTLSKAQSERASKPRKTRRGTPQERLESNKEIIAHFKRTKLSGNSFAKRHAAAYNLSERTVRAIVSE
jgi:hypothetical protein